jgi:hypothetical protein
MHSKPTEKVEATSEKKTMPAITEGANATPSNNTLQTHFDLFLFFIIEQKQVLINIKSHKKTL